MRPILRPPIDSASLPSGAPTRPGPDVLYWAPASAPQLDNTGPWFATRFPISGAAAYRQGEYLYQDFIYDDSGAKGTTGAGPGTYTYPTDTATYAGNAADLVEFRMKPLADGIAFRLTYNTMLNPNVVAATIALGDSGIARSVPHGANAIAPAQVFVTIHGAPAISSMRQAEW